MIKFNVNNNNCYQVFCDICGRWDTPHYHAYGCRKQAQQNGWYAVEWTPSDGVDKHVCPICAKSKKFADLS